MCIFFQTETANFVSCVTSILITLLTCAGTIFACIQLIQIKRTRVKQFEQSRREKTMEVVKYYAQNVTPHMKAVEKIVVNLTDDQCKDLYDGIPFEVNDKIGHQICDVCPYVKDCKLMKSSQKAAICGGEKNHFIVKGEILYFLRSSCISYLNTLESVLLAWEMNIVDRDRIEEQFAFLDKKRHKECALEEFRTIAGGGRSYPVIEKFYRNLEYERMKQAEKAQAEVLK